MHSGSPAGRSACSSSPSRCRRGSAAATLWNLAYLGIAVAVLVAAYVGLERLVRSPWGRVLRAIREDEDAAASLGKRAFVFRLQSFVIGSMLMGLGGALLAHFVGYIAPEDFLPILTFQMWAMLIVGGAGNNRGAVLGALVVWGFWAGAGSLLRGFVAQEEQARAAALQVGLIGVLIAAMLLWRPRGLVGEEVAVSRGRVSQRAGPCLEPTRIDTKRSADPRTIGTDANG